MKAAPFNIVTLTKRADFLRLNRGRKFTTPHVILRALPNEGEGCRVGYTVTIKCGNAVIRNRIKRRLRALSRELLVTLGRPNTDYVWIARADADVSAADAPMDALRVGCAEALANLNKKLSA